jgi:hypothetical protein
MNTVPHPDDGYQSKVLSSSIFKEKTRAKLENARRTRHLSAFCRDEKESSGSSHLR